jgi:hypothetical protein
MVAHRDRAESAVLDQQLRARTGASAAMQMRNAHIFGQGKRLIPDPNRRNTLNIEVSTPSISNDLKELRYLRNFEIYALQSRKPQYRSKTSISK